MLTVILYKKSSQYYIDRYRSLFQPYLDAGKIAFCFWDENGDDISSSVLKLAETVRGRTKWRAIVALPLEEDAEGEALSQQMRKNPFDFDVNQDPEPPVHESSIPLIRLAQMLGGVPLPNEHYDGQFVYNEEKGKRLVMVRREEEDQMALQQAVWEELDARYSLPFERPSYLYLFSARIQREITLPEVTDQEILERHESDSSLFWYRNRYPARARFLVQDCARPSHAHFQEDLFGFWMTLLTLAINDLPTGTLEAYKLYRVRAAVSRDRLHRVFSDYYNRLGSVQFQASKNISELQRSAQYVREMDELPHYQAVIPVEFEADEAPGMVISDRRIGFAGDCPIQEEPWWHHSVDDSVGLLRKLFRSLQVVLDRASISCRYNAQVMENEIHELDEYQVQEMQEELTELEREVLIFNTYAALPIKKYYRDLEKSRKSAATSMRKRMTRRLTVGTGLFVLLLYLAGFVPDIVDQVRRGIEPLDTACILFIGCDVLAIVMIFCLFHFRNVILAKIGDYNGLVRSILGSVRSAGARFSKYLSDCCSYMRGRAMLQALLDRSMVSTLSIKLLTLHREKLEEQMQVIAGWLHDIGLTPLPDKGEFGKVDFDFDLEPANNREYLIHLDTFDLDREMTGGSLCKAPYPFVGGLEVQRESLFDPIVNEEEEEEEA